jgi:UrcA family protein
MNRFSTVLLTLGFATGLPMMAVAGEKQHSTYQITYTSADLSTSQRVAELHARIEKTAKEHCPSYFTARSLSDTRSCVRDVTRDLVKQIDNPQLTAYAAGERSVELAAATPRG